MSARRAAALPLLAAVALGACATAPACAPVTIVVRAKDRQTRWYQEPVGLETRESGHVREVYRDVLVPEYWLQADTGRWYRVPEEAWQAAAVGSPAAVCR